MNDRGARTAIRCIVLACSAAILAWTVPRMLQHAAVPDAPSTYTIRFPSDAGADGSLHPGPVWLSRIVADDHEILLGDVEREGAWRQEAFALIHEDASQPASVRVRARTAVVCIAPAAGTQHVLIEGSDGLRAVLDLDRRRQPSASSVCATLAGGRMIEGPGPGFGWKGAATLALLALAAWWWKPWQDADVLARWVTLHVALLHVLVWLRQPIGYNADAEGYIAGISTFARGIVGYFPPGYPMFLAPFWALFGSWAGFAVIGAQHAAMVAALVALSSVARPVLGKDLATLGLVFTGSVVPTLFLPQLIYSENVAFGAMAGALWCASRSDSEGSGRGDRIAGILAAWGGLARVVPLAAVTVAVLILHLGRLDARAALVRTRRTVLTSIAVVAAVSTWNFVHTLNVGLANSAGLHLFDRVITEQGLMDRDGPKTRELLERMGQRELHGVPFWDVVPELNKQGMRYYEIRTLLGGAAVEGILSSPVAFSAYSLDLSQRLYRADPTYDLWLSPAVRMPALESPLPPSWRSTSVLWWNQFQGVYTTLWPTAQWFPLLGLLLLPLLRHRLVFVALLAVPAIFLLASAQVEQFVARFVLSVLPFALILTPAPVAAVLNLVRPGLTVDEPLLPG